MIDYIQLLVPTGDWKWPVIRPAPSPVAALLPSLDGRLFSPLVLFDINLLDNEFDTFQLLIINPSHLSDGSIDIVHAMLTSH